MLHVRHFNESQNLMNTVYFFSSEDEYQSIVKLIASFQTLRSTPSDLIYFDTQSDHYILYSAMSDIPATIADLPNPAHSPYTFEQISQYVINLKSDASTNDGLRLCCYASLGHQSFAGVSYVTSQLITEIKPHSLLILTTEITQNDVEHYFAREKTKRKQQLPRIEMTASSLDISLLHQQTIPNFEKVDAQIRNPKTLTTPSIHQNKTLTAYISDTPHQAENIAKYSSQDEPYLTAYYNEEEDSYEITQFHLYRLHAAAIYYNKERDHYEIQFHPYELHTVADNESLNLKTFVSMLKSIRSKHALALESINLCCPVHLGQRDGSFIHTASETLTRALCVSEVLSGLINKVLPTSLTLLTSDLDGRNDAIRYLSRQPTALGYQLPNVPMSGAHADRSTMDKDEFILCITSAPALPIKALLPTKTKTFAAYITHHDQAFFSMEALAAACSMSHRKPYLTIYYDTTADRYTIREISTFSRHQFYLSREPEKNHHLCDVIRMIRQELEINRLELYTHVNLGHPDGAFVTTEFNNWITNLEPEFIGLFYTEQSQSDAFLYYHRGITAHGMKLPNRNISGHCINEDEVKTALARGVIEPEVLAAIMHNSPRLPNFFKRKENLAVYLFHHTPDNTMRTESLVSFCETILNLPSIVIVTVQTPA